MGKPNIFFELENDAIKLKIHNKIYPAEAVLNTTFFFIDDYYIFMSMDGGAGMLVDMKPKKKTAKAKLEAASGEFYNTLLSETLRLSINKTSKTYREKLLELAVSSALSPVKPDELGAAPAATDALRIDLDDELKLIVERIQDKSYTDDPLGICVPFVESKPVSKKPAARKSGATAVAKGANRKK